jgi:aryl-alcohol dehydrogenase-like predicted oxidoreductase
LCEREAFEKELEPLCVKNNIAVLNYFALAVGFLTGKYRSKADLSKSIRGDRVEQYLNPKGLRILKALDEVAEKHSSTCASIAIAWLLHRPSITAPIASATSLQQLDSLIKSVDLKLTKEEIALLDKASDWK